MSPAKYRIGVAGAGIGGLAFAALAARAGHDVTIFERFATPRPVGSGLVVQPVGLAVLDMMGAGDAARGFGAAVTRMIGHSAPANRIALDVTYPADRPGLAMHRSALFHVLWQQVQGLGLPVITDATVTEAAMDGAGRRLRLADGRGFGPFDLVVDASGAGSALSPLKARPLRFGAIWGTVPWPDNTLMPSDQLRQRYRGSRHMVGILPIGRLPDDPVPRAAVFWSLPVDEIATWQSTPLDHWKADATALWPEIAPFLDSITRHHDMTPARYSHGSLKVPFGPALTFIGDAAHRASPQLGQGANMALLDALALARALERPLDAALPAYAAMRRWHVRSYQGMSALFTPMYQSDSHVLPVLRDRGLAPLAGLPGIRQILTRLVAGDLLPPLAGAAFP